MVDEYILHDLKEIFFYILLGLIMAILIPLFLGYTFGGFTESFVSGKPLEFGSILVTFLLYYIIILIGIIGLPTMKLIQMFVLDRRYSQPDQPKASIWIVFGTPFLHDPESVGLLFNLFNYFGKETAEKIMGWSRSILRMLIIGTLVFGTMGLMFAIFKIHLGGLPQSFILQQLSPAGKVFFSSEPASFSETTMILFVFSLLMGLVAYLCSRFKLGKATFFTIGALFIAPLTGLGWAGFHTIVYGNSAVSFMNTLFFGIAGCELTLLFGSFILFYVWHFWNNWFYKLLDLVTGQADILLITIVVFVLLLIAYITGEIIRSKVKRRKEFEPPIPR